MTSADKEITDLLHAWGAGSSEALEELIPKVYEDLKRRARRQLRLERPGFYLTPTDVVHETYLKLQGQNRALWHNRSQFFAIAAKLMRRFLIDLHKKNAAAKRPPAQLQVSLTVELEGPEQINVDFMALDQALVRLADKYPELGRWVELRWLSGLDLEELAEAAGVSLSTVKKRLRFARAWLEHELDPSGGAGPPDSRSK
jgi:RNA polymerase sigma-70 factor, ECF subfamily